MMYNAYPQWIQFLQFTPQAPIVSFATPFVHQVNNWYIDSGFSHHLNASHDNLKNHAPYIGNESMMLGNENFVSIFHIGQGKVETRNLFFERNNLLHVSLLAKNLISVQQICIDNYVSVELFPDSFE